MPSHRSRIETRIRTLIAVFAKSEHGLENELRASAGGVPEALKGLAEKLPAVDPALLAFANELCDWSGDHVTLVKKIVHKRGVRSMRDVASQYDARKLAEDVDQKHAAELQRGLFATQPSAVLQRMVTSQEIPIADAKVRAGVVKFFANQPDFNIQKTSVLTALKNPKALDGIATEQQAAVTEQLKTMQRVQALTDSPEAVPVLIKANLTSAFRVSELTESTFLTTYGTTLGQDVAQQIYGNAVDARIRNEQALATLRETVRGTGIAILDGNQSQPQRVEELQSSLDQKQIPLDVNALFDLDHCQCDDCMSVYSPASYFVELLQFLRNNDLDPKNPNTGAGTDISKTPLEMLFRRRPDLGCLELSCTNTNTVLPYVDLANEVMESFIVHQSDYDKTKTPPQATLDVFNVEDETSGELLAQPQHTNYRAYCVLKRAVYPFTLPYHQPIDAIRIFLKHLGTSRYELIDTFRGTQAICPTPLYDSGTPALLANEQRAVYDRAADAELLGLTQEEYIILTREAFWSEKYFDYTQPPPVNYQTGIGVQPTYVYYGYGNETDMLSADEGATLGLTFVKLQFLPRTGIHYTDLVDLLKTRFINPNYPQGQALTILDSIRATYRTLQSLVVGTSKTPAETRFAKVIEYLVGNNLVGGRLSPDKCQSQQPGWAVSKEDLTSWLGCHFDRISKLVVLELTASAPANGQSVDPGVDPGQSSPPYIDPCSLDGVRLTHLDGSALASEEYDRIQRFIRLWRKLGWTIDEVDQAITGLATDDPTAATPPPATPPPATPPAATPPPATPPAATPPAAAATPDCQYVGFDAFAENCTTPPDAITSDQSPPSSAPYVCPIPPPKKILDSHFVHQLVVVHELLDLTGLELTKLLTFWADIDTVGEQSLYARLFLTHNMVSLDPVFKADQNGNCLTQPATIQDHVPVLMAALGLKADEIAFIANGPLVPAALTKLTLTNVTVLYRHGLLARVLRVKVTDLPDVFSLLGNPFQDADHTLTLLQNWGKMQDAGFSFAQLDFVLQGHDDPTRPFSPSLRTILETARTLHDGLNAIDQAHPDVTALEDATSELVRASAGLLFEPAIVDEIMGILEGTTVYSTNAPANLTINILPVPPATDPDRTSLARKVKYVASPGSVQVTGVMTTPADVPTPGELAAAKSLSADPNWGPAIDRLQTQAVRLFNGLYRAALSGPFPILADAQKNLLAGDVVVPPADLTSAQMNTAPQKRLYFLKSFLPYLRQQLRDRLIVDTTAGIASLAGDVTAVLLSDILKFGGQQAIELLRSLEAAGPVAGKWIGYLIPTTDDDYTFIVTQDPQPAPLTIDGTDYPFQHLDDPTNVWLTTTPVRLKKGVPVSLTAESLDLVNGLEWKTGLPPPAGEISDSSPGAKIPDSALLPDDIYQGFDDILAKLYQVAILINGFNLSADEVRYLQEHAGDFSGFDWNAVTLAQWLRLQAYTQLRNSLPPSKKTLLDLFQWKPAPSPVMPVPDDVLAPEIVAEISLVTGWDPDDLDKLIARDHFDLIDATQFSNEINLVKLQSALTVAGKIGQDINALFRWAAPGSNFWDCHQIAEDIRKTIKAGYSEDDWEQVVKPLNDQLRDDMRQALVNYLTVQPDIQTWASNHNEVADADTLFEFFLIDGQMDPCLQTSRIKQAISTVQLFIQRCLLGQEIEVTSDKIDRKRWDWMQKYRVWQANREVFLYPENWIEPTLRDDKSPFYEDLEAALLQNDLDPQSVQDAVTAYLYKVDEVANLSVVGLYLDTAKTAPQGDTNPGHKLHVFGRTRSAPYLFYYRYFDTDTKDWYPWEKMQVDIPSYDVEDADGKVTSNGTYLVPLVWNERLFAFFPQLAKKTVPPAAGPVTAQNNNGNITADTSAPKSQWEIRLGWSEYRNGKWTPKQLSTDALYDFVAPPDPGAQPEVEKQTLSDELDVRAGGSTPAYDGDSSTQSITIQIPPGFILDPDQGGGTTEIAVTLEHDPRWGGVDHLHTITLPAGVALITYQNDVNHKNESGAVPTFEIEKDGSGNPTGVKVTATAHGWGGVGNTDGYVTANVQVYVKAASSGAATPGGGAASPGGTTLKGELDVRAGGSGPAGDGDSNTGSKTIAIPAGFMLDPDKGGGTVEIAVTLEDDPRRGGVDHLHTITLPAGVSLVTYQSDVNKGSESGAVPIIEVQTDSSGNPTGVKITASAHGWGGDGNTDGFVTANLEVYTKPIDSGATPPPPNVPPPSLPAIDSYVFVPRLITSDTIPVAVDVYRGDSNAPTGTRKIFRRYGSSDLAIGRFDFAGTHIWVDDAKGPSIGALQSSFQFVALMPDSKEMHSWQALNDSPPAESRPGLEPFFEVDKTSVVVHDSGDSQSQIGFYHPFVHRLLAAVTSGDLDDLFAEYRSGYYDHSIDSADAYGATDDPTGIGDQKTLYDELKRPYSLYNWELGFHAPMELADRLLQAQKLDDALAMCQYVFDPSATVEQGDLSQKPYWKFPPFKEITAEKVLQELFTNLGAGAAATDAINQWREHPFEPHLIARTRPVAYMKWVVMKYLEILIAYGDYYFTQNTLETLPLAIQLYVMASHLLGKRGEIIPKQGDIPVETYNSLLDKWDAFGNAMVELELVFPFSSQTPSASDGDVAQAGIFGSVPSLYFCIPDNPELGALRDTIDDRLFKIRHCQDINGVVRQLPLFEPPINPALLVQAAAQGLSLSSVLDDLNSPMPNYRFYYLLQKALELCAEVKALGNAFVSTKEKEDGEALARLRATQEIAVQNLVMEVRKQQVDEAQKSLDALQQSRKTVESRMQYYLKLIGGDLSKVPTSDVDFNELANAIDAPVTDGGIVMSPSEKEEMDKASDANGLQIGVGAVETLAGLFHALPSINSHAQPLGVGVSIRWGFPNLGMALQATARALQIGVGDLNFQSTRAGRKGGLQRSYQDRVQQANAAGYELKSIDKQMLTQQVRIDIANQEITNQQKQIDNAMEIDDFLRNKKYTNQELFTWMGDMLRTTYRQAYNLAYDIAKKAEKTYRFERGLTDAEPNIIQYGYWNAGYDGLLAGEQLYVDLKKLEAAHQEKRPYDYEITRPISLRQIAPLALLQLRDTGSCQFSLPEILFDMDYPGHYMRRIKSVGLTVPCVIGPYTSLNCTLRLLAHSFRTQATASINGNDYPMSTDESDIRFTTMNVPITAIAVSTGQNDAGVFELNFRDERYIPFEGAGAISTWRIDLPKDFRQFDYNTISDIVMHVRYTSVDGGDNLQRAAAATVSSYVSDVAELSQQQGLFAAFDLIHDFPNEWYKANHPLAGATSRVLALETLYDRLPIVVQGWKANKVRIRDAYLVSSAVLPSATVTIAGADTGLANSAPVGKLQMYAAHDMDAQLNGVQQLTVGDVTTEISSLWLVVRYVLQPQV